MLFDLRGGGRRRTIQAVYILLAVLMGGGLVLFGIGGSVSGGLIDAITEGGSSGPTGTSTYQDRVKEAERRTQANPKDAAAYADLARARFQLASAGDTFDQQTGQYTAEGKQLLSGAASAWQRHRKLAGKHPDDGVAGVMVQAYAALNQPDKAVEAQEVITEARPKSATFARLAILAYSAGETRTGDLARGKALEMADADERKVLKSQIDQAKQQAAAQALQQQQSNAPPAASPTPAGGGGKGKKNGKSK